ncbi:MAG: type IV pilus twitching motility protein PilT [Actinomycetota bacterium]
MDQNSPAELQTLNSALKLMVEMGASDLHLTQGKFTIRLDGALGPLEGFSEFTDAQIEAALRAITPEARWEDFQKNLELDQSYTTPTGERFRVNVYLQRGRLGAALRSIPTKILTLDDLKMPKQIAKFATLARGLVLVTGPTGSGKSTTLAALIDEINQTRSDHVMTVEDPIEFVHQSKKALINQREVGSDTLSFEASLKHVLRQDPDVILIGEMRDLETVSAALTSAETGHLVFGTLHTQDAPQTIDRIIDVFPPHQQAQIRTMLATSLKGIVCQNLLPLQAGKGRVAATEILFTTPAISNLIREGKTFQIPSAIQAGKELGMHTMDQSLAALVRSGAISPAAGLERAHDPIGFKQLLPGINFEVGAENSGLGGMSGF